MGLWLYLWLDQSVDTSDDNIELQEQLRNIVNDLRTFDNIQQCEEFIRKNTDKKIVLIVSGSFGREIVPRLHDVHQFSGCYVYCRDKQANKWSEKYSKVRDVFDQRNALVQRITDDQNNHSQNDEGICISVIGSTVQGLQSRNANFMWLQLYIEILLRMHHKSTDRKEFIDVCQKNAADNSKQLIIIEEFESKYTPDNAIWWYTRDACFYRIVNKALRHHDFDTLFIFRSFITDVAKQIERAYENYIRTNGNRNIIRVYRGQLINDDELELMQNNIGQYVSMNSFLSTSRDRETALEFIHESPKRREMQPILFDIKINPQLRTKAFADAQGMSYYQDENEILIMLGALFKIDEIFQDDDEPIWIARVSLASEDDFQLKDIFNHMKEKIGDDTNLDTLGKLLLRMHENEKARKCYQRMLNQTQLEVADAHLGFGWASLRCHANDEGLEHFEKSLKIRRSIHGDNHLTVAECYGFFGEAYRTKNDPNTALSYLTKAMTIQENASPHGALDLAATYETMGNAYGDIKDHERAAEFYEKTLEIRKVKLPSDHPQLAVIHKLIGWSYESRKKYSKALQCYQKALDISRKTLPPTHKHIIDIDKCVRRLTGKMNE